MWIDKQKTINLQLEMPVRLSTYRKGNAIPPLPGTNIFHSTELFHVFEMTRGYEPLLIVAYIGSHPEKCAPVPPCNHQTMRNLWHRRVF